MVRAATAHTLMWLAKERSAQDLELSCDETVLLDAGDGARRRYAELLLSAAGNGRGFTTCIEKWAAEMLRERIHRELGFTVNIGVSSNKLLAKIAGDFQKPNRVHSLFPEEIPQKLWPLPVRSLFLVGPATETKLHRLGIETIGDLAHAPVRQLRRILGKQRPRSGRRF